MSYLFCFVTKAYATFLRFSQEILPLTPSEISNAQVYSGIQNTEIPRTQKAKRKMMGNCFFFFFVSRMEGWWILALLSFHKKEKEKKRTGLCGITTKGAFLIQCAPNVTFLVKPSIIYYSIFFSFSSRRCIKNRIHIDF